MSKALAQVMGGLRFVAVSAHNDRVKIYSPDVGSWVEHDRDTAREIARFILREVGDTGAQLNMFAQ